jgi:diaminohydroxyphosphoribosylaminopyrimidine deaminase/5-amino-6-(5-phosphoribosylamino)uracil reductase
VVIGVEDPDRRVRGAGVAALRSAGVEVEVGVGAGEVARSLAPYLKHRSSGRPWVVLKLACTLDGRIAAPDGSSRWITGPEARADAHALRAESDAVLVGAGTVRADDPRLTVRNAEGRDPLRIVLGKPPQDAKVLPATAHEGDIPSLLDELGAHDVLQLLVEGGARVAGSFHRGGFVDQYVIYLAPAIMGGDDGVPSFAGAGAPTMDEVWRGAFDRFTRLGSDLRIDVLAGPPGLALP